MTNTAVQALPDEGLVPEWTLADRLDKSLRVRGISVAAMGEALDVSRDTVSRWINGRTKPSKPHLWFWAILTGVDHGWLETGVAGAVDGPPIKGLPRLDSNQQPFGERSAEVSATRPRLRLVTVKPGLTADRRALVGVGKRVS